jgi:hypothetical protein
VPREPGVTWIERIAILPSVNAPPGAPRSPADRLA